MSRATPTMRELAARLIDYETKENRPSATNTPKAFLVSEKMRPHLATLMGKLGFRTLLSRALALANAEAQWLGAVHLNPDGSFEDWEEVERKAQADPDEIEEGGVALIAQLMGLLVAFIGESLTLRLVHEIWPAVSLGDLDFGEKGEER